MRARESERGTGRVGEGRGECVAPSGASSGEQVSRRWPARAGARWAHALASFCQEEDDDWQMAAWAGLHSNWAEVGYR